MENKEQTILSGGEEGGKNNILSSAERTNSMGAAIKHRRSKGVVVSDKMNKTRVVAVVRLKKHPKYLKYYKLTRKFKAHDENNESKKGDEVIIQESRPLSKDKRWIILKK